MADLTARRDSWLDYLPGNTQQAINTSPVVNALSQMFNRPSPDLTRGIDHDQYGNVSDRNWLMEQARGRTEMNPVVADGLNKLSLLAAFASKSPNAGPKWVDAYHGAIGNRPYSRFNPGYEGASFHAADPALANEFATIAGVNSRPMVYKNRINVDGFRSVDWPKVTGSDWYSTENMIRLLDRARHQRLPGLVIQNMTEPLGGPATRTTQYAVIDPSRIRSFTAAFDPWKAHLPDLMASRVGPALLAAGIGARSAFGDEPQN